VKTFAAGTYSLNVGAALYACDGQVGGASSQWTTAGANIYSANTGNVGIGTTSPTKKLDVAGDINFTGDLYKNGVLFGGANFGNQSPHSTYSDCNTTPASWGWTYVQNSTNCPNSTSGQWYR
jgi:hypothetical protein